MNAQVSVNQILNRLSHYVARISANQFFTREESVQNLID
jgi:hypothetical protein